jgi:TRAP-type C4-dicarboxylate transport system permease small subunit
MDERRSIVQTLYEGMWKVIDQVLVLLCGIMVVAVFLQVIFRYVIHFSLSWSEELARYTFTWLAMLGAAVAVRRHAHFTLEVLVRWLPARIAGSLIVLGGLGILAFLLVLTVQGVLWAIAYSDMVSPAMQIGYYLVVASVPVSAGLMMVESTRQLVMAIVRVRRGQPVFESTTETPTVS